MFSSLMSDLKNEPKPLSAQGVILNSLTLKLRDDVW